MSEEKKYDDETQKFYEENKEMIEKILAQEKASAGSDDTDKAFRDEMLRRAAFEQKMRMEYEAEKARRQAFETADKAYSDFKYGRERTEAAFDEAREHFRDYGRRQGDRLFDLLFEDADRYRDYAYRGRQYARDRFDSDREAIKESRERARGVFNDGFDEFFGPFADAQFQRHMVGAGLEFWMALNSLIKSAPVPESVKTAFNEAEANKDAAYCGKNPHCRNREQESADEPSAPRKIQISKKDDN